MIRKLGRGVANVATGVFEIPISIQEKFYSDGPMAAATYGLFDGIYKLLRRTVVGAYEIVTFPIPFPADYAPIVEPEFLFAPEEPYAF
jgi:putative exosortase-associated protein (TIGR04073 family)